MKTPAGILSHAALVIVYALSLFSNPVFGGRLIDVDDASRVVRNALHLYGNNAAILGEKIEESLRSIANGRDLSDTQGVAIEVNLPQNDVLSMTAQLEDDPEYVVAEFVQLAKTRGHVLNIEQEFNLLRYISRVLNEAREQQDFDRERMWTPPVKLVSPTFEGRYPTGERIYVELEQLNPNTRQVCLYFDYDIEVWCGSLPQHEPIFFTEMYTRAHVLTVTRKRNHNTSESNVIGRSHFYASVPSVRFSVTRTGRNTARADVHLYEWCNGAEGNLKILLDGVVVTPALATACTMAPDESFDVCISFDGVPPGEHVLRALLVTKDGNAIDSTNAVILRNEGASVSGESTCPVHMTWPTSSITGCETYVGGPACPSLPLPQRRPLPKTTVLPWLRSLRKHEWGRFSQNGEDGVLLSLLQLVRPDFACDHDASDRKRSKRESDSAANFYVEFGVESGKECNTRFLREACGWTGLQMDGSYENASINLHRHFIDAESINRLFELHSVPPNLSVLVIDIDNNDFWVWKAIDSKYRPQIVIVEYNAHILPSEARVVPYVADRMWDGVTSYFGAGVAALEKLARSKGYSLVYCEKNGVNCFFVREDLLGFDVSKEEGFRVEDIYRPPNFYNKGWKYPYVNGFDNYSAWLWVE